MTIGRLGPVQRVYLGYAPEYRDNGVSSSGGVNRQLIAAAIERQMPVICLGKTGEGYEPLLMQKPGDMDRVPGSIYHSVSFVRCLDLLKDAGRPCVLVSTPCQLEGVLAYVQQQAPELRDTIALTVGLICGWMYSHHALQAFAAFKGLAGDVRDAAYRGEDEKGMLKLRIDDREHRFRRRDFESIGERLDYAAAFSGVLNRQRCRLCQDHLNVLADLAVGDAWLERKKGDKLSILVVRTGRGAAAVAELQRQGRLVLEDGDAADICESQSDNLVYGHVARQLARFRRERGLIATEFHYGDQPAPVELSGPERRQFRFERLLRGIVRRGWYRSYRLLYRLYRWRSFAPRWLRRMLGRLLTARR